MEGLNGYQRERYESIKTNVIIAAVSIFFTALATHYITAKRLDPNNINGRLMELEKKINIELKQANEEILKTNDELKNAYEKQIELNKEALISYKSFERLEGLVMSEIVFYADSDGIDGISPEEARQLAQDLGCGKIKRSVDSIVIDIDPYSRRCQYRIKKIKNPESGKALRAASINIPAKRAADYVSRRRGDR